MVYLDLAISSNKRPNKEAGIGPRKPSHLKPITKEERLKAALKRKIPAKDQVRAVLFNL